MERRIRLLRHMGHKGLKLLTCCFFCLIQEYKVSSCEQRLISEIEYRLERSPVDESGDDIQYGDVPVENGVAPFFETKLKHYKIFEGMPVTFTCRVTGNPKPKVSRKHGFLS